MNVVNQEVEIIGKVAEVLVPSNKRHKIIVGGRGKGASWSIARLFLLKAMHEPLFIPCIREVQKTIAHSVKKILEDTIKLFQWEWFFEITKTEIRGLNGSLFVFYGLQDYNADNIKSLEGADLCWVAEAQSISRRSVNILRPTIRKPGSEIWWDFNPRYPTDPIWIDYIENKDPEAEVLWLNWRDNPWFPKVLKKERDADFKRNETEARHIWEGELRDMGDKYICPLDLVNQAMARTITINESYDLVVGADIAHQGGDEIVFYKRLGKQVIDKEYMIKDANAGVSLTQQIVDNLVRFMGDTSVKLNIDNGYIGAAVADLMEDLGFHVNRINFGGVPKDTEHYADCATEMYAELRDQLYEVDIPMDEQLRAQLIQRKYNYINGRRGYEVIKIESKDEFSAHASGVNKSPDRADALVLTFYEYEGDSNFGVGDLEDYNIF